MSGRQPSGTPLPTVVMAPFEPQAAVVPLPPPPRHVRLVGGARLVLIGRLALALGAALLMTAVFITGWHHCRAVRVTFATGQFDDSYYGAQLVSKVNGYSLAVWAFVDEGFAIPLLVAAMVTAALALLTVGAQSRVGGVLVVLGALVTGCFLALNLRMLPRTVADLAMRTPSGSFPSDIHPLGLGPGPMTLLALVGLILLLNGGLLVWVGVPRALPRATDNQAEREQYPVHEFEAGRSGEHGVQGAPLLPQHAAQQWDGEWQAQPRQ